MYILEVEGDLKGEKEMKLFRNSIFLLLTCLVMTACGGNNDQTNDADQENMGDEGEAQVTDEEEAPEIDVEIKNSEGSNIGTAVLTEVEDGVRVRVQATHLSEGTHAIHFHEKAVCEAPDFESSGGHFNPDDKSHGLEHAEGPHAGDLPNLEVEEDGTVNYDVVSDLVTLDEDAENSLIAGEGTALVIHEDEDDGESQPAGDAGARVACGEIKKAE